MKLIRPGVKPFDTKPVKIAATKVAQGAVKPTEQQLRAMSLGTAKQSLAKYVEARGELMMEKMVEGYPERERETWPVQILEAQELLQDSDAEALFLRTRAQMRGADPLDFANTVITKNSEYRVGSATILGLRDVLQAQIEAAANIDALLEIDLSAVE